MSEFRLTTIEEFEAATERLLETGKKVGADSWQLRVKNQTPHCKFGVQGICCRICTMGPCRITPKAPRGICGCDAYGIAGRNFLRFTAGGAATHSDHGREICHTFSHVALDGNYRVKDTEKLLRIAKEWGVETDGKDIYDLAHEMAELALMEYGKPHGVQRWLKRAPEHTQKLWYDAEIEPRAIDREVAMRRGVPMAGNFLQQENVMLTGACEAIVVDVRCIFPALGPLSKCFHTKFITTSPHRCRILISFVSKQRLQEKMQKISYVPQLRIL